MCKVLAFMVLSVFPLMHAGGDGAGTARSDSEAFLFATLVGVVVLFLCMVDDLADTNSGLYSVTPVREMLQTALLAKVDALLRSTQEEAQLRD